MSLQDTYYLTNIIVMILAMVLLTALVIFVFYIMRKFTELSDGVNKRLDEVGRIVDNPADVASDVAADFVEKSARRLKKVITDN